MSSSQLMLKPYNQLENAPERSAAGRAFKSGPMIGMLELRLTRP